MSRIGKQPIDIPQGVEIKIDGNTISAKGPKGELRQVLDADLTIKMEDGQVVIDRPTDQKRHKAMHGLYRSLVSNMVEGVSNGYTRKLIMTGVGFRANATGQVLELNVGYSHPVVMALPPEVKVSAEQLKGQDPVITLESHDKQLIGQVAAKIRSVRKPEPYKGKGIRYSDEYIRRKAGKAAAAK